MTGQWREQAPTSAKHVRGCCCAYTRFFATVTVAAHITADGRSGSARAPIASAPPPLLQAHSAAATVDLSATGVTMPDCSVRDGSL